MGSTEGRVMHIKTGYISNPSASKSGYVNVGVRGSSMRQQKHIDVHRFVFSCFNDDFDLESDLVIDHINNNRRDNRIDNLQSMTRIENNRKAQPNRNMSSRAKCPTVPVLARNTVSGETLLFKSQNTCGKYFSTTRGTVSNIAHKHSRQKFLTRNDVKWTFRKATDDELRDMKFTTLSRNPIVDTA